MNNQNIYPVDTKSIFQRIDNDIKLIVGVDVADAIELLLNKREIEFEIESHSHSWSQNNRSYQSKIYRISKPLVETTQTDP